MMGGLHEGNRVLELSGKKFVKSRSSVTAAETALQKFTVSQ